MDTKALAAAIAGFLLGGFVVSLAASLDDDRNVHASMNEPTTSLSRVVE